MSIFKAGLIQHKAIPNDIEANLEAGLKYFEEASKKGADIVLFPEMWSHGYAPPFEGAFDNPKDQRFEKERQKWLATAVSADGTYVRSFREAAKKLKTGVVATFLSKGTEKPRNTAVVIDKNGKILMEYSKIHTCDFSMEALLESGNEFKVCDFDGVKIGLMICFDREFPESARILMLKGAEIILVPNASNMDPARINAFSTRAFENMTGAAMANYPFKGGGRSCAFSPIVYDSKGKYIDNAITFADDTSQKILIAEFDMDKIRKYRRKEPLGNSYRKIKAYADLVGTSVSEPFIRRKL